MMDDNSRSTVIFTGNSDKLVPSPFWILRELKMMKVVVTTVAIRHAKLESNHHNQQTNIQHFTGQMPFLSPNQQCQCTEWKRLAHPKLNWGLPTVCLTIEAPVTSGRGLPDLSSAL